MATFDFSIKPVETLRNDMDRLTILRPLLDAPPVMQLVSLMNDLLSDDAMPFDIQWAYHDFAAAVLGGEPPVVTGDRWRDSLIEAIFERENVFSVAASKGLCDDALLRAYARDLSIVQHLFLLDDAMVRNWCTPSQSGADLSGWAGFSNMGFYIVEGDGPLPSMRRMLLSSEDWSRLAKPLMDMHAQHGAGATLGHRYIQYDGETFEPVARVRVAKAAPDPALAEALRNFSAGEAPRAVLVCGPDAIPKSAAALTASGLHVVRLRDISLFPALCDRLEGVRARFAVLMPSPHPADPMLSDLLGTGLTALPQNVMPVATYPVADPMLTEQYELWIQSAK